MLFLSETGASIVSLRSPRRLRWIVGAGLASSHLLVISHMQRGYLQRTPFQDRHETHVPTVLFFKQLTNRSMRYHDYFCVIGLEGS